MANNEPKAICNEGRQPELDIARGLAVIFMVLIHTVEYYWDWENEIFDKVANFLGSPPAAPVFMFLLGCGIIYSKRSTPQQVFKRGLKMLGLSYVFNALVYVLPYAISALIEQDVEILEDSWTQIYDADILQFAAIAFIFFAIVLATKMKPWLVVVTAACISGLGMLLNFLVPEVDSYALQAITGLFWGTHEGSYFPFTSWILYPAVGYAFAYVLKRTTEKKKLYLTVSPIGGVVYLITTFALLNFFEWDLLMDGEYYYVQNIFFNIMFIGFVFLWIGICYALYHITAKPVMRVLEKFSSNVTIIYICQYTLIIYIEVLAFGDEAELGVPLTLALFVAYTLISYFASIGYKSMVKKNKAKKAANG